MRSAESTLDETAAPTPAEYDADWEEVAGRAVERFGTPCYVTRIRPIMESMEALDALEVRSWLSCKTHPLPPLIKWWTESGRGVEVVSETEFTMARRLGCTVEHLLINGVAKHSWLPRHPVRRLRVHFDSVPEIDALLPRAVKCKWRVGIRVQAPDERDARDPRFGGQFGMTADEAVASLCRLREAGADVESVHFHLGQRHRAPDACVRAVNHVRSVCEAATFRPRYLDLGGGLPAPPSAQSALADLRAAIALARSHFGPHLEEIWLENGRFITNQSSVLAVRVVDTKLRPESRYLICDGGRTNHALAADNGLNPIATLPLRTGRTRLTTICGPTCMTDDTLGRVMLPESVVPGDVLLWMNAGAYHLPWETRFSHGLCAVVWCDESDELFLARERELPDEWATRWKM